MPTASAISSTHSMLISVESMSNEISLKSCRRRGGVKPWMDRPGENSVGRMGVIFALAGRQNAKADSHTQKPQKGEKLAKESNENWKSFCDFCETFATF